MTDGRFWLLVHAVRNGPTSVARFDADLWQEEPILLRAFATLLGQTRVLPAPKHTDGSPTESLAALFARTADAQAVITSTLGGQVRQAVELFVSEVARLDRESGGTLLDGVSERDLYRGALTTLMRLVFLLYAEQKKLLPINDPTYADGYAVTTLYQQLSEARDRHGEEVGDRRSAAWPRLLATFAAVHGGCEHPDLRIPAHGGSLFDPAGYRWLGRVAVTDRVVHEVLDALLMLRHRGKAAERLSYDGLSVEQIGHVYEGLLEFSCLRVSAPHLGLSGKLEPEVPLAEVEAQGDALPAWLMKNCGLTAKQVEKALAAKPTAKQAADLHAACDNDAELAERVLPFWGLLRTDLRGLPTVFPARSVLFTQVGDRRATGTHYTPRDLAKEVVEHTLAPLCFVRETEGVHRLRNAEELLALKVCDPTMGSGAFLVAACEYLAERLVEAWQRDGQPDDVTGTAEEVRIAALRLVAAKCIYGVDRDDMAVELAKLSMWLLTLARDKPFGFLDHALRCGDSLIGVRTAEQIEAYCLDPTLGRQKVVERFTGSMDRAIAAALTEATKLRQEIERRPVNAKEDVDAKAALLARSEVATRNAQLVADGVVAAALSTAGENETRYVDRLVGMVETAVEVVKGSASPSVELTFRSKLEDWLTGNRSQAVKPFHWPLEFPEVMANGGFVAVVGNPPFIGGTMISGRIGRDVLHYLQRFVNRGARGGGRADLCSYFLLRDLDIMRGGRVGIIATNTIAQNDTREVGLDQVVEHGWDIYRAEKSQPWPGSASLEVSLVWVGNTDEGETFYLDGNVVKGITPSLAPKSRVSGNPHRLDANTGQAFIGSYVLAIDSFALDPEVARELIGRDRRNRDVLYPLINGVDLNSRPDCSAARWVVNFHDWPWDRVIGYSDVLRIIEEKAKPVLARKDPKTYVGLMDRWWQYWRIRAEMLRAIAGLERVLVITRHGRTGLPAWVPTGQVFTDATIVFATDRDAMCTLLSSNVHFAWWTIKGESTMRTDPRYTPSDGFETFAQPELTARMDRVGVQLHEFRRSVMLGRELGLTKLYNRVHDEAVAEPDIVRLREIHVEVDEAVAEAYGWTDLDLRHGFHDTRQGRRFTIDPVVQVEILDRLLELNFERYDQEVKGGRRATKRASAKVAADPAEEGMLF
ncbi:Eco57I restriction-modification methylase domain-containing protein [Actinophytocola glycyrrhizae]|uniref:Eco57I restriction-modification methylase domain-containing protein n=1 Tax=Actinophytocola glycyrrhizae TaxID=2044873 RepID=UPI00367295D2